MMSDHLLSPIITAHYAAAHGRDMDRALGATQAHPVRACDR